MMFVLGGRGWDCDAAGAQVVIFACDRVRSFSSRVSRGPRWSRTGQSS